MDQGVPEGTCSQVLRSTLVDLQRLRASKFSMLKLIEIVILWVYYTIPFGLSFFRYFLALFFNFFNYFVWLRITDEGSIPEMRIWSILLINSDLKWCIHLSRSLYLYYKNKNEVILVFLFGKNKREQLLLLTVTPRVQNDWFFEYVFFNGDIGTMILYTIIDFDEFYSWPWRPRQVLVDRRRRWRSTNTWRGLRGHE